MNELFSFGATSLQLYGAVVAADIAVATAHFAMDTRGDPNCKLQFLGEIFKNNRLHHAYPKAILRHGWIHNLTETAAIAVGLMIGFWALGFLHWTAWVFAFVIAISGVVHRWHHIDPDDLCLAIRALYWLGLIQSRKQHMEHHQTHNSQYAVVTNIANHLLEHTKLFHIINKLMQVITGRPSFDLEWLSNETRRVQGHAFRP